MNYHTGIVRAGGAHRLSSLRGEDHDRARNRLDPYVFKLMSVQTAILSAIRLPVRLVPEGRYQDKSQPC